MDLIRMKYDVGRKGIIYYDFFCDDLAAISN